MIKGLTSRGIYGPGGAKAEVQSDGSVRIVAAGGQPVETTEDQLRTDGPIVMPSSVAQPLSAAGEGSIHFLGTQFVVSENGGAYVPLVVAGAAWGSITGTLSSQTDLQNALNLKAPLASPTFTGTLTSPISSLGVASATKLISSTHESLTHLFINAAGASNIQLQFGGSNAVYFEGNTGHLKFNNHNTADIGATGANSPRTGYFGTSVVAPVLTASTSSSLGVASATSLQLTTGGALNWSTDTGFARVSAADIKATDGGSGPASLRWGRGSMLEAEFFGSAVDAIARTNGRTGLIQGMGGGAGGIGITIGAPGFIAWNSQSGGGGTDAGNPANNDLFLTRAAAANLRHGAADAAAPVAQTISVQNVVAGTSNTAGANFTIAGSQGTGTGVGGSLIFQVAPAGGSGSSQNALQTALTIDSTKDATFEGVIKAAQSLQLFNGANRMASISANTGAGVVGFTYGSDVRLNWTSQSSASGDGGNGGAVDTTIYRVNAGTVGFGTTAANASGSILATNATLTESLISNASAGIKIANDAAHKLGFWNATPVVQQILATGSTADQVIGLLQTLGLCRQS